MFSLSSANSDLDAMLINKLLNMAHYLLSVKDNLCFSITRAITMSRLSPVHRMFAVAVTVIGVVPSVHAAPIVTSFTGGSADGSTAWSAPGFDTEIGFVAEGRIGALGGPRTFELKVAPDTSQSYPTSEEDYRWINGQSVDFTLDFDGTQATWTVGGTSVVYNGFSLGSENFDSLVLRSATPVADTGVVMEDLTLNGSPLGGFSNLWNNDAQGSGRQVNWLAIQNAGDLGAGFNLTGNVALSWSGEPPKNSHLAFQIKGASGPTLNGVPEPTTLALLGLGMLSLGFAGVRRRKETD